MATTTTLTSLASSTTQSKELCTICESQPYDLICTCGDKFDFNCIHQHVEQISFEFQEQYDQVTKKLTQVTDLKTKERRHFDAARTLIENWVRMKPKLTGKIFFFYLFSRGNLLRGSRNLELLNFQDITRIETSNEMFFLNYHFH
jgi:hypothetical protein